MAKVFVLGLVAVAAACGAVLLAHSSDEIYAVPGWAVTTTIVLVVVAVAGGALIVRSRAAHFGAIVATAVALGAFGVLAILSIGIVALALAAAMFAWAFRAPSRPPLAIAGGALLGVALPVLVVFAMAGTVVDCSENGARAGENVFLGLESSEGNGEATSSPDGRETGSASGETYEYTWACDGDRLVEFELRRR